MVHYIRLLSCPQVKINLKGQPEVSAVAAVTTDLGDDLLWSEIQLLFRVIDAQSNTVACISVPWKPQMRVVKLTLPCLKQSRGLLCQLCVSDTETPKSCVDNAPVIPPVLGVWSAPFRLESGARPVPYVERRFNFSAFTVRIHEEMGDSIARHVWDAALACLSCLQSIIKDSKEPETRFPVLNCLLRPNHKSPLSVIELGAGCGLVGIALATAIKRCCVLLTDLPEAEEILLQNVKQAQPALQSQLQWQQLNWEDTLDEIVLPKAVGLVVVADCVYNTTSIPPLVQTISKLLIISPNTKILVARKPRHDSERMFFDLLRDLPLKLLERFEQELPRIIGPESPKSPNVEFYLYGSS